ncbi:hypothetical protein ABT324_05335 [Saccharopolyspora sp. NPDC000359]
MADFVPGLELAERFYREAVHHLDNTDVLCHHPHRRTWLRWGS